MKVVIAVAAVAGAALAGIACVPQSRWIIVSHLDVLLGRCPSEPSAAPAFPQRLCRYDQRLPEDSLATAFPSTAAGPSIVAMDRLEAYAKLHPSDSTIWAHILRLGCTPEGSYERVMVAARAGESLEPENAVFALMAAAAHSRQGRSKVADAAIERAAAASYLAFHALDEADLRYQATQAAHGYRGERLRQRIYSSVAYPSATTIMMMARKVAEGGDSPDALRRRSALLKVSLMMARSAETLQELRMGADIALLQIGVPAASITSGEAMAKADEFDRQAAKAGLSDSAANRAIEAFATIYADLGTESEQMQAIGTRVAWASALLGSIIVVPIFLLSYSLLGSLKRRWPQIEPVAPHVAAVFASLSILAVQPHIWTLAAAICVFFSLASALGKPWSIRIGAAGCAVLIVAANQEPLLLAPVLAFFAALLAGAAHAKWVPQAVSVAGIVAAGAALAASSTSGALAWVALAGATGALAAAALAHAAGDKRIGLSPMLAFAALSVAYVAVVGSVLTDNDELRKANDAWIKRPDELRRISPPVWTAHLDR